MWRADIRRSRVSVGRRAENIAVSILSKAPGVVVELVEKFQRGAIGFETKNPWPN
jgi:hypothetical protein